MQLPNIMAFKENEKEFNYLKANSAYFKDLNRGTKNFNNFVSEMKVKYKERTTDKLASAIDNMEMVTSILDVFK